MMVALLMLLLATWITWVLFRDEHSVGKTGGAARGDDTTGRDREQRAGD